MTDLDELQELMNMVGTRGWKEILIPLAEQRFNTCLDVWMNKGGLTSEMAWKNSGIASVYDILPKAITDRNAEPEQNAPKASTQRNVLPSFSRRWLKPAPSGTGTPNNAPQSCDILVVTQTGGGLPAAKE